MKKIIFTLSLTFTVSFMLLAQNKMLKPLWLNPLRDTSFVGAQQVTVYTGIGLSLNNTSLVLAHTTTGGMLTSHINEKDGTINWEHRRSHIRGFIYNPQTKKNNGCTAIQFSARKDGNIDLIASVDLVFPPVYPVGRACRFILDAKNGKEKAFYYSTDSVKTAYMVNHGDRQNRFLPINDGKGGFYLQTGGNAFYQVETGIYRVDSSLVLKETIAKIDTWKDSVNFAMTNLSELLHTGNSFCYISSLLNYQTGLKDTLSSQIGFCKIKKNETPIQKSLSTAFYNTINIPITKKLDDGFLLAGRLSPKLTAANNNNPYQGNDNFVAKVDTNGNVVWRTVWSMNDTEGYSYGGAVALSNQKGYFLSAQPATGTEGVLNLIYVSEGGKFVKEFTIDLGEKVNGINNRYLLLTKNGNLVYAYNIGNCDFENPDPKFLCNGVFLLNGADIQKILSDKTLDASSLPVSIFPNPAQDHFTIQFKEGQAGIATIFDLEGKAVQEYKQTFDSEQWQIPLEIMQNGLYFVQIQLENGVIQTEKIMVQR
jgi:hypothetical protein